MLPIRSARSLRMAGLMAAALAALPTLEWCPLADWVARVCDAAGACVRTTECAGDMASPGAADSECAVPVACARSSAPLCDREPDPLPAGDRLWCIQPPVIALVERADALPLPQPFTLFGELTQSLDVPLPGPPVRALYGPEPRPPALREAHAPPQPRAPPVA